MIPGIPLMTAKVDIQISNVVLSIVIGPTIPRVIPVSKFQASPYSKLRDCRHAAVWVRFPVGGRRGTREHNRPLM